MSTRHPVAQVVEVFMQGLIVLVFLVVYAVGVCGLRIDGEGLYSVDRRVPAGEEAR